MVDADGEVVLVHRPQVLEDIFGQKACVGEDQRGAVAADFLVELRDRPGGGMTAPRHPLLVGQQDFDLGRRARFAFD